MKEYVWIENLSNFGFQARRSGWKKLRQRLHCSLFVPIKIICTSCVLIKRLITSLFLRMYCCNYRPVHGLIFLFKWQPETEPQGSIVQDSRLEKIFFAKQVGIGKMSEKIHRWLDWMVYRVVRILVFNGCLTPLSTIFQLHCIS